jgi:prepilin-type N-terminal cleavage/methylation domain-containing protein
MNRIPNASHERRRRARGFTLVELTVALVAGLIVALGIVALSREATRTFHEEARGAAAEATLRTAIDRLRADLQRAAFMSTGNIMADSMIATAPGASNVATTNPSMAGILRLASISYVGGGPGGSLALNTLPLSGVQTPALAPDMFEIGGNLTTSEQFSVLTILPPTSNCTRILLNALSPAIFRVGIGSTTASLELRNLFQPIPPTMTNQFIVRLVDPTGRSQYLATCPNANAAGFTGSASGANTQPYVDIDTANTPIQFASSTGTQGGANGPCSGCLVNPVHIARWEITTSAQEAQNTPQYAKGLDNLPTNTPDPAKYDLVRTYVDATGAPVYATSEVVAEYAVDLKLAFSVDTTTLGDQAPTITTYAFDDATGNTKWSYDVSKTLPPPPNVGPQRIRSVRVRLATRAAQPDRTVNVLLANYGQQAFIYRYCVNSTPSCATNDQTLRWARARTLTTEVSLPNQARAFF